MYIMLPNKIKLKQKSESQFWHFFDVIIPKTAKIEENEENCHNPNRLIFLKFGMQMLPNKSNKKTFQTLWII